MTNGEYLLYTILRDASTVTDATPDAEGWIHLAIDADWWNAKNKEPDPEPNPEESPGWEPTLEDVAEAMINSAFELGKMANAAGSGFENVTDSVTGMLTRLWIKDIERRGEDDNSI